MTANELTAIYDGAIEPRQQTDAEASTEATRDHMIEKMTNARRAPDDDKLASIADGLAQPAHYQGRTPPMPFKAAYNT